MHARLNSSGAVRGLALLLGALGALLMLGLSPSQAHAAGEEQSNTISGTLRNSAEGRAPVPGVTIIVTDANGTEHTGVTDDEGKYSIEVPGEGGEITVRLDEDTLPDGVELRISGNTERTANLDPGESFFPIFPIGPDTRTVETKLDQFFQLLYNGFVFGIVLSLGALGLSMVFGTTGLTNFAHGELITFGAIMAYFFNRTMGLSIFLAAVMAMLAAGLFGWLLDSGLFRPLRRRGTGLIAMMILTIGLQFLLRNIYQYFTGGKALTYSEFVTPQGREFGSITYSVRDLVIVAISLTMLLGVTFALSRSRLGRATRAVADNPALAASTGINVNRVISAVWIVGTALAGLCGVFLGFTQSITFQLGAQVLLLVFAATCIGGLGSIWGAMLGSVIIGLLVETSTLVIPSELKYAGAMALLILILLIRPQGILGRRERIG